MHTNSYLKSVRSGTTSTLGTSTPAVGSSTCPKCVTTKKSGKLSCCARGGAWYKNCGDAGDSNFDHTWGEGIQACKGVTESMKTPLKVMLHHVTAVVHSLNNDQIQTVTPHQKDLYFHGSASDDDTNNCDGFLGIANVAVFLYIFLNVLSLQKQFFYFFG